jgi:hypothetical protein
VLEVVGLVLDWLLDGALYPYSWSDAVVDFTKVVLLVVGLTLDELLEGVLYPYS